MSVEEKLQSLVAELRVLESYFNEVTNRQALVARIIVEGKTAIETINGLSKEGNNEVLIPIGGGVYLHATSPPPERLVVGVGADVAIEKSRDDAIAFLEERIREAEATVANLERQKAELTQRINSNRAAISKLMEQQRQGQG